MKLREIITEYASAGATSTANVSLGSPTYTNKKGEQPAGGIKTKHGKLAPNALDIGKGKKGSNLITGGSLLKR